MFDFSKNSLLNALVRIFERESGKKITGSDLEIIESSLDTFHDHNSDKYNLDHEVADILLQDKIEQHAHDMRMTFMAYLDCFDNLHPSPLKKNFDTIRVYNRKVISISTSPIYKQIKKYAYNDLFRGEFSVIDDYENPSEIIECFNRYANNPSSLSISEIADLIPDEYKSCVNEDWFSIE